MDKRDVKTLAGTASHFLNLLKGQEFDDGRLVDELKKYLKRYEAEVKGKAFASDIDRMKLDMLKRIVIDTEMHLKRTNKNIRRNLEKAYVLAVEKSKSGEIKPKDLQEISELIEVFPKLMFIEQRKNIPFGLKSKKEFLATIVVKLQEKGFDNDIIELIKERIDQINIVFASERSNGIIMEMNRLDENIVAKFKVKRRLISLGRHRADYLLGIDSHRLYIEIFFDKDLTQKKVKHMLENHLSAVEGAFERSFSQTNDPSFAKYKLKLQAKKQKIEKMGLDAFEKEIMEMLKDVISNVFRNNKKLLLSPNLRCQMKVKDIPNTIACCSRLSRMDHYLFEVDINYIILRYLTSDDFYQPLGSSHYKWLYDSVTGSAIITDHKRHNVRPEEMHRLELLLNKMKEGIESYRTFSLYSILAHEATHAWDNEYLMKALELKRTINFIAYKTGLYNQKSTLNLGREVIALLNFYDTCRTESVSQMGEWIANYQASLRNNTEIGYIQMKCFQTRDLIRELNSVIEEISREDYEKKMDHVGRFENEFGYYFGYLFSLTIFLAYCKTHNRQIMVIDERSFQKFSSKFPEVAGAIMYNYNLDNIKEGHKEYFMARSLKGNDSFRQILKTNGIRVMGIDDVSSMMNQGEKFYIFNPPTDILQGLMNKIKATDQVAFLDLYEKACDVLGLRERVYSIRQIKDLADKVNAARSIIQQKAGFHGR